MRCRTGVLPPTWCIRRIIGAAGRRPDGIDATFEVEGLGRAPGALSDKTITGPGGAEGSSQVRSQVLSSQVPPRDHVQSGTVRGVLDVSSWPAAAVRGSAVMRLLSRRTRRSAATVTSAAPDALTPLQDPRPPAVRRLEAGADPGGEGHRF
jgi:hypothetical protein